MNDETCEKGLAIRREVLGAEYADKSLANADDFYRNVIIAREVFADQEKAAAK